MLAEIIGGLAVFGLSEIFGEVYHDWNRTAEENIIINAARKVADLTEGKKPLVIEQKVSESLSETIEDLDNQIENNQDLTVEDLANYIAKISDIAAKNNTDQTLNCIKNDAIELYNLITNGQIEEEEAKKLINQYAEALQPYIEESAVVEEQPQEKPEDQVKEEGTFTVEATKIPDFTTPVKPILEQPITVIEEPLAPAEEPVPVVEEQPQEKPEEKAAEVKREAEKKTTAKKTTARKTTTKKTK